MTRKLKALGLAMFAVFALSAVAVASAQAAEEFHSEAAHTVLTGTQDEDAGAASTAKLSIGGVTVECRETHIEGDQTGTTSATATVRPRYNGTSGNPTGEPCTSFAGSTTVATNMCHYKLGAATDANGHATASVICPAAGEAITISSAGCIIKITGGPNNKVGGVEVNQNLKGVHYTNTGSGATRDITVKSTITGIHFTTNGAFACVIAGLPATGTNASYTGDVTTKGFNYTSGETTAYVDGAQVGIFKE
jgi:hypothetical protein